jgi:hypothetical protein
MKYQVTISNGRAVIVHHYNRFMIAISEDGQPLSAEEQSEARQKVRDQQSVPA